MRRRFEHLVEELSVLAGQLVPRYALWLRLHQRGLDPERLGREQLLGFCRWELDAFLHEHGIQLSERDAQKLRRAVARHDPAVRTPYEWAARI
jgi:hypothetical protein